ncbi:MAG: hypothetical protein DMG57_26720 [Acidobacteria bacterium]|nr:MAG: hypothetical protein DMG57_26720 [Acidobacteriota bacterium]
MALLDRYLQAVKFWLPKAQKQDIIAELSEDIRSQIDEKEIELRSSAEQYGPSLRSRGDGLRNFRRFQDSRSPGPRLHA